MLSVVERLKTQLKAFSISVKISIFKKFVEFEFFQHIIKNLLCCNIRVNHESIIIWLSYLKGTVSFWFHLLPKWTSINIWPEEFYSVSGNLEELKILVYKKDSWKKVDPGIGNNFFFIVIY